ncbi:ACOT13 [Bugula neritina]|uniref:Acyl-coenzyme A thioesterase 13 n=1 Tax=Bugula neritina TaxID=10212 RepID=A0A7J7K2D4_BUGNE|nr:ACOT13 [Bugula neritina]
MAQVSKNIRQAWEFLMKRGKGFDSLLKNAELISAGEGTCKCKMVVEEHHVNKMKTLHGGMTATLVDSVSTMALVCTEPYLPGVSVDLSVSYLRGAPLGEEITIDAKALKIGKNLSFLTVDVTDSKGKLIAQGKHTKFVSKDQPVIGE